MDTRKAVKEMLSNLSKEHFTEFCDELVSRKEKPRVALNRVEGKSFLDITKVLLSTFSETGAVQVAAEVLNLIGCNGEAAELLAVTGVKCSEPGSPNTAGPSAGVTAQYTMVNGEHFVDKHKIELINRVDCVADILDQLFGKKVIKQAIYNKIRKIPTSEDQMRELFSGPLNAAGLGGKEVFYRILEQEETFLIDELKAKK